MGALYADGDQQLQPQFTGVVPLWILLNWMK